MAEVVEGVRPDTIAVSYHYGTFSPGLSPAARARGPGSIRCWSCTRTSSPGMNSFNDTKCKLYKA